MNKTTKNVGIWIRVSTDEQAEGDSPEHHEKRARFYAESKGWNVVEKYQLNGVSGKSVRAHAETQRMLEDLSSGKITGLIFSKLARLARNTRELLDFADFFQEHSSDLISLQEAIDTSTPAGRLFYTMIAAMAQWEREEIASRVAASIPIRAKLGKPLGGPAPFGYRWDKEKKCLSVDPVEAPIRRQIYDLFLKHRRFRVVARMLNEAGYRLREGGPFHGNAVQRYLTDPIVKGSRRINYTQTVNGKVSLKPESDWVFVQSEPLVTEEVWEQCQAVINQQRRSGKPGKRTPVHLFAGSVRCFCKTRMYVLWNTDKYVCKECRNKIPIADLEEVFHEQLKSFVLSPTEIVNYLSRADEKIKEKKQLLESLESERAKVNQEMQKIYRLYIEDGITSDGFRRQYRPLEERLAQLEDELPALQGEVDFLKIQHLSGDQVISDIQDLYAQWPNLQQEEKRSIIESIVEEIIIGKDDVTIHLGYVPPPISEKLSARITESAHAAELRAAPPPPKLVGKLRQNLIVL
jgi:site-specific DNA recombinase